MLCTALSSKSSQESIKSKITLFEDITRKLHSFNEYNSMFVLICQIG